jgi:regulator of protease activity HflC (stomatin/prohibitin superfamily)
MEVDDDKEVNCSWTPAGVCEDVGDVCSDDEVGFVLKVGCGGVCCLLIVIMTIILIACSVETIDSTEMGIAYNAPQAILEDKVKEEGLHGKPPFGYFILWPRTHQTMHQTVNGMSSDGVVVKVEVAFQYKVDEKSLQRLTLDYKDVDYYKDVLQLVSRSGIRNACMKYKAQEFQTKRAAVQTTMFDEVQGRIKKGKMNSFVLDLQLTSVDRPDKYEKAVDDKENARNAIDLVTNLRAQKMTQAYTNLAKVRVEANKTIDSAKTEAAVTTKNAEAESAIVYGRYQSQGALYKSVRQERGLSSEGLLAYIGTRLIDELGHITVGLDAPARVAYGTMLNKTA